jgi:shikimate kinase
MKIYLIGMPGSGKTTLGEQLAEELLMPFVDLDAEIESREGRSITDIFAANGEEYFRRVESALLHEWAASQKSFVMATGGGAPCFHDGVNVMNNTGLSVFLDVNVPELLQRLKSKTDRPLLGNDLAEKETKLKNLRSARLDCYSRARITVTDPTTSKVLDAIRMKQ